MGRGSTSTVRLSIPTVRGVAFRSVWTEGKVEIKRRATGERRDISLEGLAEALSFAKGAQRRWGNNLNAFAGLFSGKAE